MLKGSLVFMLLTLSISSNATIIDLGDVTRDTSTGLDWLDLTHIQTYGLSYNQVLSRMESGRPLEGWRYATPAELDQLLVNLGHSATNQNCPHGVIHCDSGIAGDSQAIENIIFLLGDTYDLYLDQVNHPHDVSPTGRGFTRGLLATQNIAPGRQDIGFIGDNEIVLRNTQDPLHDFDDRVFTLFTSEGPNAQNSATGSFIVTSFVEVPMPASIWLFATGLMLAFAMNYLAQTRTRKTY